jgi:hypothetical protein
MIVKIAEDKNASLTFSEGMMKVTMMDSELNVKWFREHDFVGEMLLGPSTWGGFPHNNELSDWRVEFYSLEETESPIHVAKYNVNRGNVLVLPISKIGQGKVMDIHNLVDYCKSIQLKGANVHVFFEGSELFDLEKYGIKPLRINQEVTHLSHIIEIEL